MDPRPWQILAVIGVLLAIGEFFVPSFFVLPAGLGFLMTAAFALFIDDWTTLLGLLGVNLLLVYGAFYRFVWPKLQKVAPRTGAEGMVGKVATVSETVIAATGQGYVKLYGDEWRVVAQRDFAVGERVVITGVDGNKVVVEAVGDTLTK